jgi:hypothetical protein
MRLLMNRCSGLLFSMEKLQAAAFGEAEADFVGRNLAKARLALGDVLLTAHRQYHWSCVERHHRLQHLLSLAPLDWETPLVQHHAAGVDFKLHPRRSKESREALSAQLDTIRAAACDLWLWLESYRLASSFTSIWEYSTSSLNKCPHTQAWKNFLLHLEALGGRGLWQASSTRYPRERLLRALPLLLFDPAVCERPESLQAVQSALCTSATTFPGLVDQYRRWWHRFN